MSFKLRCGYDVLQCGKENDDGGMESGLNCVCNVFYDMGNVVADSRSAVVSSICIIDVCTSNRYCANIGVHDITW